MSETVFNTADQAPNQEINKPDGGTPATDIVAALVGEGRKYKSVEDLAKAYVNADGFIETLKSENHQLREVATRAKTLDEVFERLQHQEQTPVDKQVNSEGVIAVSDVAKIVDQTIAEREATKTREANLKKADAALKNVFGEKAGETFQKAADSPEKKKILMDLAAIDPDAFVALFVPKQAGGGQVDAGGMSSAAINFTPADRSNTPGTKEYFDKVRRSEPDKYYSQDFQLQMDKAVRTDPAKYYGRN